MVNLIFDRVGEVSATTGTGSFALGGAATGYRTFQSVFSVNDTPLYIAVAVDGSGNPTGQWEIGKGTLTGTTTLARTVVYANSAGGTTALSFAGGSLQIWCGLPAEAFTLGLFPAFPVVTTKNADWTFTLSDVNSLLRHTDGSSYTWTIDTWANAGIGAGNVITGTSETTGTLTIAAPSSGSLIRLDGVSGTGNRTIGGNGMFTLMQLDGSGNNWGITGTGLS